MKNFLKKAFTVTVVVTTIFWAIGLAALLPVGASAATMANGDLIKIANNSAVYYYSNGSRYIFPLSAVYFSWYSDFSGVKVISDADMAAIPMVTGVKGNVVVRPGTKLIKVNTDPKVYAVGPNGVLHHVDSEARATALYGANWAQRVIDMPDVFFTANYSVGSAMAANVPVEGSLVKSAGSSTVYYVNATGQKQSVDSGTLINNRFKLSDVVTLSDTIMSALADGGALTGTALSDTSQNGNVVIPPTGALTVSLASDTPVATSVPYLANNVPFTYVNLAAGSNAVTVTGLKVTRVGLGSDANFTSAKIFIDGVQVGNSQSLNSSHQAVFSSLAISIPAGTTKKVVLAGVIAATGTAVAGHMLGLSLSAASDITTTASIGGTFPINGNQMTISSVTIGTVTLDNGSLNPSTDMTVDPDAVDFRFTQVKINAATEDMKLTQLTALRNGTAGDSDVKDIKLYNDTTGTLLGTVATLTNGRAVFSGLNVAIAKGSNVELSIKATMVGGSGRTIAFDLNDGVSYLMNIVGQSYGFAVTPTRGTFCTVTTNTCQTETINQGYLTVTKSALTPATGNIPVGGSKVTLAAFDFKAGGEPINITSTGITITPGGTGSAVDYTSAGLYDSSGNLVAGTQDYTTTTAATAQTLTYTDAYTVPLGTHTYYVKANVSSSAVAAETVVAAISASSLTAKGATSGKVAYTTSAGTTVPPGASAISGNTMTIQGAKLTVTTAATPVAASVVANAQAQTFANFDLDATAGGEDVKVTQLIVTNTLGNSAALTDLLNLTMWGDPDNTDATDQNVLLETSNSTATNAATVTFTFKTPIKVSHLSVSRLTLKADVAATLGDTTSPVGTQLFYIPSAIANVTATAWTTGTALTIALSTLTINGSGQAMSTQANGALTVNVSADRPSQAQFVAGSTGNAMMSYKFAATYEDIDVTQLNIETTSATAGSDVARVKLYVNGTSIGATTGYTVDSNGHVAATLAAGAFTVPKDAYSILTIKVDLADKTQLTDTATLEIGLADDTDTDATWGANGAASAATHSYYIVANGKSSGATLSKALINSTGVATGTIAASFSHSLYRGLLTVALDPASPSGTQTAGTAKEVMRLKLTAVGDAITITDMEFKKNGTCTASGTNPAYLKSADLGTTYATWATGTAWLAAANFSIVADSTVGSTLEVAAGDSKSIVLIGDTAACTTANQTVQITLGPVSDLTSGVAWKNSAANSVDNVLTKNLPVLGGTLVF